MAYAKSAYQKLLVEIATVITSVIDGTMRKEDLDREMDFIKSRIPALPLKRERLACTDMVYVSEDVIIQNYIVHAYKYEGEFYTAERHHVAGCFGLGILLDKLSQTEIDQLECFWIWRNNRRVYKKLNPVR